MRLEKTYGQGSRSNLLSTLRVLPLLWLLPRRPVVEEIDCRDLELGLHPPVHSMRGLDSGFGDQIQSQTLQSRAPSSEVQEVSSEEDCWGTTDEESENGEDERASDARRDELILQALTMGLRIDAHDAPDVHREAGRISLVRLNANAPNSGAQGEMIDEEDAQSLLNSEIILIGAVKAIGGLIMSKICNGKGVLISGLGSLQRSGGGQAAWLAARAHARGEGACFALLVPVKAAKLWWAQRGFKAIPEARQLRRHRCHGCQILRSRAEMNGVDFGELVATLLENAVGSRRRTFCGFDGKTPEAGLICCG